MHKIREVEGNQNTGDLMGHCKNFFSFTLSNTRVLTREGAKLDLKK